FASQGYVRKQDAANYPIAARVQAAAVEATLGRISTPPVRHSRAGQRLKDHLLTASRALRLQRRSAGRENQNAQKQVVATHDESYLRPWGPRCKEGKAPVLKPARRRARIEASPL